MTARVIIVPGAQPSRDANGRNLPGKFRFYLPNTTTPAIVYTDNSLTVPHPFPLLSDSAGRWPAIWADDSSSFDVGWSDQVFDKTIATYSGVTPAADAVLASTDIASAAADVATAEAATATTAAQQAQAAAATAVAAAAGLKLKATSETPHTIGSGTFVFVLDQHPTDFAIGMDVLMADITNINNLMTGGVSAFDGTNLTVVVAPGSTSGAGTPTMWSISLTAIGGVVSLAGLTGILTAAAAKAALAIASTDITDFEDAVVGLALNALS